jgi:filamentous hemagglutinin family protein
MRLYQPGIVHPSLACTLSITGAIALIGTAPALAQITPDTTLGAESSIVTPDAIVGGNPADLIEGGALRGSNVFHSFIDFNVAESQRVYFANPNGINNIVSRVTGGNVSNIFGTLGVDGAANLFLLNPNGILFGPNAQLDVAGSFSASTGDRFSYLDGSEFNAVNPNDAPLVTVNITPGVQLVDVPQGDILNAADLEVGAGQTLALLGNTVINSGDLTAAGGTVQVLGNQVNLVDQATINVSGDTGGGNVFIGGEYLGQGSLPTAQHTVVEAGVNINADALISGDGGTVIVWADDATEFAGSISARAGCSLWGTGALWKPRGLKPEWWHLPLRVDTTAAHGQGGLWLLDPADLTVQAGGTATIAGGTNSPATDTTISAATIVTALDTTAVLLLATNSITVDEVIDASGNATANTLTFDAPTLTLNQNVLTEGGQVYDGNVVVGGANIALTSDAGTVTFNNAVDSAASQANSLTVNSSGAIAFNGAIGSGANGALSNLSLASSAGTVALASSLTLNGNLGIAAGSGNITDNGAWAVGGNATFTTSAADADITLDTTSVTGSVGLNTNGAGGDATFTSSSAVDLAASTVGGALDVTATTGNITDSGAVSVGGDAIFTTSAADADITLDTTSVTGSVGLNTNGTGGNATFISGGAVNLAASTIGGALAVTAGGAITDSGTLTVTGNTTLNAGANNITLDDAANTFGTLALTGNDVSIAENAATDLGASTVTGALSIASQGAITDSGTLAVTGNTTLNAGANNITLDDAGNTFGTLALTGNDVSITENAATDLGASTVTGALSITSQGAITDSGAVTVGGTSTFTSTQNNADITLDQVSSTGAVSLNTIGATGNATFTSGIGVNLAASTVGGALTVTATTGNIIDSGAVSVGGTSTFTTSAADADITLDTTSVTGTVSLNTSGTGGDATLSGNAVNLAASTVGGALDVTATTGNITDSGAISVGGNATFTTSAADADITLDTTSVTGSVGLNTNGTGGDATFTSSSAVDLAASTIGGALAVTAGGAITDSGNLNVTGDTTLNAGGNNITLDSANNSFGTLLLTGNDVSIVENAATDLGASTVTGALSITSQGAITDSGTLAVTGTTTLDAGGNNITLDDAANTFGTLALTGNDVSIVENAATDLGASTVTGALSITSQGAITDSGTLAVTGNTTLDAGGNNITLDDAANTFGTLALTGNDVSIVENAATDLGASTITGALAISSQGAITDSGVVTVNGTSSFTSTQNNADITLDQVSPTGAVSLNTTGATGNATFTSSSAVNLAASTIGGSLTVTSTAPAGAVITDSGTVTVGGDAAFTTTQTQADITLDTLDVAGNVAVTTTGNNVDVSLTGVGAPTADISLGNVSLSGVGSTFTVAAADGITINTGTIATTGTQTYNSPVTTAGIATLESSGGTLDFQSTLAVNADLTLRAPTISFGAAVTPTGSPTITLEPFDASANLNVASLGTGQLQDGFGAIVIGRTDGTGTVNVGTIGFQDPVTIRTSATGAIAVNGALTGTDDASITLSGPTTLSADVITAGQNITFNNATTLGAAGLTISTGTAAAGNILFNSTLAGAGNGLTATVGSGDITFSDTVTGLGALIAHSAGTTAFNNTVQATSLTTDTGGTTTLNGDVTTSGAQTYGDDVRLNSGVTLTTTNSAVSFSGAVDSQAGETNALTISSGAGNATFTGAVGANQALAALTVNSTGTTAFDSTVQATSLTTDAGGTTTLNGNVTTSGTQTYGDAVQVNGDATLATTNSAVTFDSTVNSQASETNNLTVTTGNGAVAFNAAVGGAANGELGALAVNSTGTTTFASTVEADTVATNAGGTTVLNGNVTTTGTQTYGDNLQLNSGLSLTTTNSDVTVAGTVNSEAGETNALTVNSGSGNVTLTGALGSGVVLGAVTVNSTGATAFGGTVQAASLTTNAGGTTSLNGNVTTTGAQTYNDAAVTINSGLTLNSNNNAIAFAGTIDSQIGETNALTINSGTAGTTLGGTIGGITPLGALDITTGQAIALPSLTVSSLAVDADGVISQQGGSSLTVTGNASFNTQGLSNVGDVNIGYSNVALDLGASRIGGDYTLLSADSVSVTSLTQSGAVQVAGLSNFNDSDADGVIDDLSALTNAGNRLFTAPVVDGSGNVIVNQSGDVDLSTDIPQTITGNLVVTTVGQLDFVGQLTGGTAVNLNSATNSFGGTVSVNTDVPAEAVVTARILQSDAINGITVGGTTTLNAIGGSIQADTLSNNFDSDNTGDGVILNSGTAAIADVNALDLAAIALTNASPDGLTVTAGGALTNSGAIAVAGDANLTTTGTDADITLNQLNVDGTVTVTTTGANADATLTAAGTPADITLGALAIAGALDVTATGGITLNGGTVTSGSHQTYNNDVTLGTGTTLTSTAGGITLGGTVNGAQTLATSTATGTTLNGTVGNASPLTGLVITGPATVNTAQVITDATTGDQVFNGAVTLGADATFSGNDVAFNSTVNSDGTARNLTVTSNNSGTTTFGGAVGAASALASVTTNGDGTVAINGGTVATTNNQTYNDAVTLGANASLTSTGGVITFNNTVNGLTDGGQTLTVNGANGVVFGNTTTDIVGGTNRLAALTVTGATTLNGSAITTTGSQAYNSNVTLGTDVALTSSSGGVTFDGTLNGANNLAVSAATGTIFNNTVGNITDLASLTVVGPTTVNTSQIETTGNQTYGGAVTVNTAATLQSGATLDFQSTLGVNADLVLRATAVNFGAAVTPSGNPAIALEPFNAASNLNVAGLGTNQLQNGFSSITIGRSDGTGVVTVGSIGFQDPVIVQSPGGSVVVNGNLTGTDDASFTFTGPTLVGDGTGTATIAIDTSASSNGSVLFNNAVNAAAAGDSLVITAGSGDITFSDTVGTGTALGALTATTTGTIGLSGDVTTINNQIYNGNVVLGNTIALTSTAGAVAFSGNLDATTAGGEGLTVTTVTGTTFGDASSDAVGGSQPLSTLTVNGPATLNASSVDTSGNQVYNGSTSVVNDSALTSSGGILDFNNTLATTGNLVLTGTDIDFANAVSTSNGSNITLQPSDPASAIQVGQAGAGLALTAAEIAQLQDGFGLITIGRSDDGTVGSTTGITGAVTIAATTFLDNLLIQGGSITANGNLTARGQDVTLIAYNGDIDTSGRTFNTSTATNGIDGGDILFQASGAVTAGRINTGSDFQGGSSSGNFTVRAGDTATLTAFVDTTSRDSGNGGNVDVQGASVTLNNNVTIDPFTGSSGAKTGNTTLRATTGDVTLGSGTLFGDNYSSQPGAGGGDIQIISDQGSIVLQNRSIGSTNSGTGAGGSVLLSALQGIQATNSFINTTATNNGAGGSVTVQGGDVTFTNTRLTSNSSGSGAGGSVSVTGLDNGAGTGSVTFTGTSSIATNASSSGAGGGVSVQGTDITSTSTSNPFISSIASGSGTGGSVSVVGTGAVTLTGSAATLGATQGGIIADSRGSAQGGSIAVQGATVDLTDITVSAGTSGAATATALGGGVSVNATGTLSITNSRVSARTDSTIRNVAGNIVLGGSDIDINASQILAETSNNIEDPANTFVLSTGEVGLGFVGGNITFTGTTGVGILNLQGGTLISARAIDPNLTYSTGIAAGLNQTDSNFAGGNIRIDGFSRLQALNAAGNNDIVTSARNTGGGGVIAVSLATVISGFDTVNSNDLAALRADTGNQIASNGAIVSLDISLLTGDTALDVDFVNASELVGASCSSDVADSSFSIGGRGGLPLDPTDTLLPSSFDDNWIFLEDDDRSLLFPADLTAANLSGPGGFHPHSECYFQWQQRG